MKGKKGATPLLWVILLIVLVLGGTGVYFGLIKEPTPQAIVEQQIVDKDVQSCSGVQSVNLLYNDQNRFASGTDPGNGTTVYQKKGTTDGQWEAYSKLVNDDATSTTVPILSQFKALASNNKGTPHSSYFGKFIEFETVCSDKDVQTELCQSGAPSTFVALNDDGVTKNTGTSGNETVAASGTYTWEFTVRAPSDKCSSTTDGAVVACEYDATYVQKLEAVNGVTEVDEAIYLSHLTIGNATMDKWATFKYGGELADGTKDFFTIKMTATSTAKPSGYVGAHNINCTWLGVNNDLDADTFAPITGIYDEDNNIIAQGIGSLMVHTK